MFENTNNQTHALELTLWRLLLTPYSHTTEQLPSYLHVANVISRLEKTNIQVFDVVCGDIQFTFNESKEEQYHQPCSFDDWVSSFVNHKITNYALSHMIAGRILHLTALEHETNEDNIGVYCNPFAKDGNGGDVSTAIMHFLENDIGSILADFPGLSDIANNWELEMRTGGGHLTARGFAVGFVSSLCL